MRLFFCSAAVIFLLSACDNNKEINSQLLHPRVKLAQQFIGLIQNDNKYDALIMTKLFSEAAQGFSGSKVFLDSTYSNLNHIFKNNKFKRINEWTLKHDTLKSHYTQYYVPFEDVLVPFEKKPHEDTDPAYFYVSFEIPEYGDIINNFGIITKAQADRHEGNPALAIGYLLTAHQSERIQYNPQLEPVDNQ